MRLALIQDLIKGEISDGCAILVEYDPASKWFVVLANVAAGWLAEGGNVSYNATTEPLDMIRSRFSRLGVNVLQLESTDRLRFHDYYTTTLGLKSSEKLAGDSLKAADMSIDFAKTQIPGKSIPHVLRCLDSASTIARFNDEKSWIELILTRVIPMAHMRKSTGIGGIVRAMHSSWAYNQLENAFECIIDLKQDESDGRVRDVIRVRKMLDLDFDSSWHALKVNENLQVSIE